mgnify:CR=1 FL=1
MNVEIFSDECKIIANGSFMLKNRDSNARIHLDFLPEYNYALNITFNFSKERTGVEAKVERKVHNSSEIEFVISNTEEPAGNGTMGAQPVAIFADGKTLSCNYIFSRPTPDNVRTFTYSFYIEG